MTVQQITIRLVFYMIVNTDNTSCSSRKQVTVVINTYHFLSLTTNIHINSKWFMDEITVCADMVCNDFDTEEVTGSWLFPYDWCMTLAILQKGQGV